MFSSFIRSILFHILVVLLLYIFSNYLSFSKKTLITEIPLEIVDISDKTKIKKVVKKKVVKKEVVKEKVEENFRLPDPVSKPKIPEFVNKKRDLKKKKKEVKKTKEKVNRLSSILKSIDEVKDQKKKEVDKVPIDQEYNNKILESDEKLTISELDMIRRQFIPCWNIPAGAKNIQNLKVLIKIKLDEDGNVLESELIKTDSFNNSFYRAAAESAMRAIRHPSCKKLKVPVKKYKVWKNLTLNFDPSMINK